MAYLLLQMGSVVKEEKGSQHPSLLQGLGSAGSEQTPCPLLSGKSAGCSFLTFARTRKQVWNSSCFLQVQGSDLTVLPHSGLTL